MKQHYTIEEKDFIAKYRPIIELESIESMTPRKKKVKNNQSKKRIIERKHEKWMKKN